MTRMYALMNYVEKLCNNKLIPGDIFEAFINIYECILSKKDIRPFFIYDFNWIAKEYFYFVMSLKSIIFSICIIFL